MRATRPDVWATQPTTMTGDDAHYAVRPPETVTPSTQSLDLSGPFRGPSASVRPCTAQSSRYGHGL